MTYAIALPPQSRLQELFTYDPDTGVLTRIHNAKSNSQELQVSIDGVRYVRTRIIWRLVTGVDPGELEIDHKNCDNRNNRWSNLRLSNRVQNMSNTRPRKGTKTGIKGVYKKVRDCGTIYVATGMRNGKRITLGNYNCLAEASAVREAFCRAQLGEFYRHS